MTRPQAQCGGRWQALLLVLPWLLWLGGCGAGKLQTLPAQITGEWRSDDARYQGRFMRLETDEITFGLGGAGPDEDEHIESVTVAPDNDHTDYTIRLRKANGQRDALVLLFSEQDNGELRLKNQSKIVWKRKENENDKEARKAPQKATRHDVPLPEVARPEPLTAERVFGGHRTLYKIDCIRPNVCHSY